MLETTENVKVSAESIAANAAAFAANPVAAPWPEPQPFRKAEARQVYPIHALPKLIREAVVEVVGFVQCPAALAACSALAVLSLAAQGIANVRRDAGLVGPLSLFFLATAESGERKTTVDTQFMRSVWDFEKTERERLAPEVAAYEKAMKRYEAERDGLLARIKEAARKGKNDVGAKNDQESLTAPVAPRVPNLVYQNITPEGLAKGLHQKWPSGGVMSSEAAIVFGSHAMNPESVMRSLGLLNVLWELATYKVERATTCSFVLDGVRLTLGLAVQPGTVRAFFDGCKGLARESGFAARFLICAPESTQGTRFHKDPPNGWPALARFHARIAELLAATPQPNEAGGFDPLPELSFAPDAKVAWVAFHDDVERELAPDGEMTEVRDVASKAADNVARMAGLFHLLEDGKPDGAISAAHVKAAAAIVQWHLYEARRFLGEMSGPRGLQNAERLDAWLLVQCATSGEVTANEILQFGPNTTRTRAARDAALAELEELGRVRVVPSGQGRRVIINPRLLGG